MVTLTVLRRVPTYDFVIHTECPVATSTEALDKGLSSGPSGIGGISESRVSGRLAGSSFELRYRGLVYPLYSPVVSGYAVENGRGGSDVICRVEQSRTSRFLLWFGLAVSVVAIFSMDFPENLVFGPAVAFLMLVFTYAPVVDAGQATAAEFQRFLPAAT